MHMDDANCIAEYEEGLRIARTQANRSYEVICVAGPRNIRPFLEVMHRALMSSATRCA